MALHAVDDLGDAVDATRRFLFPPTAGRWLRLAVVVFFAGGAGTNAPVNFGSSSTPTGPDTGTPDPAEMPVVFPDDLLVLAAAVAGAAVLLWLVVAVLGAVMEFVLVESLREEAVHVRRYARRHWRRGLRLFAFRVGVSLLGLLVVGALGTLLLVVLGGSPATWDSAQVVGLLAVLLPVVAVVAALWALVNGFTTAFVVPVVTAEERSVLGGWRRFYPTLRGHPKEYGAYAVVAFVLTLALGVVAAAVVGVGAAVLAVPFVVVVGGIAVAAGVSLSTPVAAVAAVAALVYVLLVVALFALVQVPLRLFTRYYSLLVLGDTNGAFDLVPAAREAVRA